ncbi:glycosyltransferase family 2 protein [Frankia sp. CiP3]|uniref:glycosyltransferase family 2 protein n=1 Tax=Frankia sp. CiP3 TaxID=2880971 RepID=UPI001EF59AC9|nr:glycosyltransferase family 2 protein [Frankia sp. CiP3]
MNRSPALVAVVGPVEPALLNAFVEHYRGFGIDRFLLAFHFPENTPADSRDVLLTTCRELLDRPEIISSGPWHEFTNTALREELRARAGEGWHLLADVDEFQCYPASVAETIAAAEAEMVDVPVVGGVMLDRVAADGRLRPWAPEVGLDRSYPLGGFLTHRLLRGDPRKVVLVRSGVEVASGNHRSPGRRPVNDPLVIVHHCKWRGDVVTYLARRAAMLAAGRWQEQSPAVRDEAHRLLAHVEEHAGRLDVSGQAVLFGPVTMDVVPSWWADESRAIVDTWRPPAG